MAKIPSTILRLGVVLGLAITIAGIIVQQAVDIADTIISYGLLIIVLTPITALSTICMLSLMKRDFYNFTLSLLIIITILVSIIISVYK